MRMHATLAGSVIVAVTLLTSTASLAGPQQQPGWIHILYNEESNVGIKAQEDPYVDGAPRAGFPVTPNPDVCSKDGRPVTVLEFFAWLEGDGARVLTYGLQAQGVREDRKYLGSQFVTWGESVTFEALERLGIEGVTVTAPQSPSDGEWLANKR